MIIAVDAMGGDHAPAAVVEGVLKALREYPQIGKILLVGQEERVRPLLLQHGLSSDSRLELIHASQVVEMTDKPAEAIRGKKDSSIAVCMRLAKEGKCQAVVSAGNTGASVAASVFNWRTLPGIDRPGIATLFPNGTGHFVLLDAGATVDCTPEHLLGFAVMGDIYAQRILGIAAPRIGLLSNGTEEGKGNDLTKKSHELLKKAGFTNYLGNVEGRDLFDGSVDVVVCDGFVGNIVLKSCESIAKMMGNVLKTNLMKNPKRMVGAFLAKNAFAELKKISDYTEYGGAPFLGVNGVFIKAHGSSNSHALKNAIRVAGEFVEHKVNAAIIDRMKEIPKP